MNVIKEIEKINAQEFASGIFGGVTAGSWHEKYKDSAWVYIGGMSYELTEGDIICFMSQWGEIEDINLVRDKTTNKSLGYAFVKYDDQRSTILAVDNFNGIKLLGRVLRCDHVDKYKLPKEVRQREEELLDVNPDANIEIGPGHVYKNKDLENNFDIKNGQDLWRPKSTEDNAAFVDGSHDTDDSASHHKKKIKSDKKVKAKKEKKDKKKSDKAKRVKEDWVPIEGIDKAPLEDVTSRTSSSKPTFGSSFSRPDAGAAASWRGNRDPALLSAADTERRRQLRLAEAGGVLPRRDEFAGFGGMKRTR